MNFLHCEHDCLVFCFPSFNNYLPLEGSSLSHGCLVSLKALLRNMVESFLETQIHLTTKPSSSLWLLSPSRNSDSAWCRVHLQRKNLGSFKVWDICLFNNFIPYCSFYCLLIGEALYRNMPLLIMVWLWQRDCFAVLFYVLHRMSQKYLSLCVGQVMSVKYFQTKVKYRGSAQN